MTKTPTFWVYGFEPFLNYSENITQKVLHHLPDYQNVHTSVLPVVFEPEIFTQPVQQHRPDVVLGMGQYPRGGMVRLERRAVNLRRDKSKNEVSRPITEGGPDRLTPSWSIQPNHMSRRTYNAGQYVCNYSMYQLSLLAESQNFDYAFIHIPKDLSLGLALWFVKQLLTARGAKL